ncbi:hypothetical protein J4Q44_G00252420 [Coregonus suidteri]|uniref:Uncharacterized protein n=1 Tax=Coregonus suidteri TaxID=861788 RepID=A0AAN8QMI0_9TELE
MKPGAQHFYIMRGQYLCNMEQFDLTRFCIKYAAEMNKALGSFPIQQAAVQSFLGNDAKAIACLEAATNNRPSPPILILLGKTQMKASKFMPNDALVCKLRADVRGHMGLTDKAVEDYRTAVELKESLEG